MKDKINFKIFKPFGSSMARAELPLELIKDFKECSKLASDIVGYPIMLKATAGGGGMKPRVSRGGISSLSLRGVPAGDLSSVA